MLCYSNPCDSILRLQPWLYMNNSLRLYRVISSLFSHTPCMYTTPLLVCHIIIIIIIMNAIHPFHRVREVKYTYQSYSQRYHQLFGLPLVVKMPRAECTYRQLYSTIITWCKWVWTTSPTAKSLAQTFVICKASQSPHPHRSLSPCTVLP